MYGCADPAQPTYKKFLKNDRKERLSRNFLYICNAVPKWVGRHRKEAISLIPTRELRQLSVVRHIMLTITKE